MEIEPSTAVGTGLAILGSKDVLLKLLGPTADYVGGEVKGLVTKCNINLDNIFKKAWRKLGAKAGEPGEVNPRVLKHVIDEGRFCEDELAAEYYGGILASARSGNSRDDRGVTVLAIVKDLSVYQLRTHFIFYSLVHRIFKGSAVNLADRDECGKLRIWIPEDVYFQAMDFQPEENVQAIQSHVFAGLSRHRLVQELVSGNTSYVKISEQSVPRAGIVFSPTIFGAEVFLSALGMQAASGGELLQIEIEEGIEGVTINEGSRSINELRELMQANT